MGSQCTNLSTFYMLKNFCNKIWEKHNVLEKVFPDYINFSCPLTILISHFSILFSSQCLSLADVVLIIILPSGAYLPPPIRMQAPWEPGDHISGPLLPAYHLEYHMENKCLIITLKKVNE